MGNPPPLVSPWRWESTDIGGRSIAVEVAFDNLTHLILAITTERDPGCEFTQILMGLGVDGRPNSTNRAVTAPDGLFAVPALLINQLVARGIGTIDNVLRLQMTAA